LCDDQQHLFSLMVPPMADTRSRSLGLDVLWSTVNGRQEPWTRAVALESPKLATVISPLRHEIIFYDTK
jgi:hypothetical protein